MRIKAADIVDTFAEAFDMWASRVVITADTQAWAHVAATAMTGFATSVIGCKCEASVEREVPPNETPDLRPGVSVLLFTADKEGNGKRLIERIGQCVMTCPTTACFNGLDAEERAIVGGKLRYFGDGYQISKVFDGRRLWRVPVMEGEFLVEDRFGIQAGVGGGNLLILGKEAPSTLKAAEAAVTAMRDVAGVIMPFPQGIVRCGSKPGSKYTGLMASTNEAFCPTLRPIVPKTELPAEVGSVYEIVIDGLDLDAIREAMRRGIHAAAHAGATQISAGNYGGNLGQHQIRLRELVSE